MKRSGNPVAFLTPEEDGRIRSAIAAGEKNTSAEIKFVICRYCWGDLRAKAVRIFRRYGMDRTRHRNGVLILLVLANREFIIYGDAGITVRVGPDFWDRERQLMETCFREDRFGDGVVAAVTTVAERLAEFFPPENDDVNEISDEVGYVE